MNVLCRHRVRLDAPLLRTRHNGALISIVIFSIARNPARSPSRRDSPIKRGRESRLAACSTTG
jgi:hypothetical protein